MPTPAPALRTFAVLVTLAVGSVAADESKPSVAPVVVEVTPLALPPGADLLSAAQLDLSAGRYVAPLQDGRRAELSLDVRLQVAATKLFVDYRVPAGALVAIDPRTGRVLALAQHTERRVNGNVALTAIAPAASVFKLVTTAALLEAGIRGDEEICYHGGRHRLQERLLEDTRRDHRCITLSDALAKSTNVAVAKLAQRNLEPTELRAMAERFLFNAPIALWPSPSPVVAVSKAQIPDDDFGFAESAAGFGDVHLSPLHGALIAAAVANGGLAHMPTLVESIDGEPVAPSETRRFLETATATELGEMMKLTVEEGTARRAFRERRGWALPGVQVAGKTGSLSSHQPFQDYSWFVGYAPADHPTIAVAALVVNEQHWRIHASYVAREAFRTFLLGSATHPMEVAQVHRHHKRTASVSRR